MNVPALWRLIVRPRTAFSFFVQHQKFTHLAMFTGSECHVVFCGVARPAAEGAEIVLAHHWIMRQQDTRPKRNKGSLYHVKIKLVLV